MQRPRFFPSKERMNLLQEFSVPLIAGSIAALVWANVSPESYHRIIHEKIYGVASLHFLTNDLFMVLFFGIAAVEITRSCLPGGSLHPIRKAVNPLLATFGGIAGPVGVYLGLNALAGDPALTRGWGIPTATDIALAWLAARTVFGEGHPAVPFLILLAVADDAVGLAIIAVFYPDPVAPTRPVWLLLTALGMVTALAMRKRGVRSYWPYLLVGGPLSWTGLYNAHLHPALTLVFIAPFMPHGQRTDSGLFEEVPRDASPLARFEHDWKVTVDFGMFLFGLVNVGVELTSAGTATWLILASLAVGKTAGIFSFALLGRWIGYPLPQKVGEKELLLVGMIAGVGLTVAVFIAGEAFTDPVLQGAAKLGALLSGLLIPVAILAGKAARIGKPPKDRSG